MSSKDQFGIVKVVESNDPDAFQGECEVMLQAGYVIQACSCGFIQSEFYNFCSVYHAVFVREEYTQK